MHRKGLWVILLMAVLLGGSFLVGMAMYFFVAGDTSVGIFRGSGIGVVTVEGPIIETKEILEDIEDFRKEKDIKAVILRVDSPGGAVAASQEIFEATKELSKKKPVVVSMGTVAASGGYYISCAANRIFANPGTTTGSIGVRLEHMMIGDLLEWAKVKHETLKSGKLKDMMPFDKPISPEARKILQDLLDDIHKQFKQVVMESRKLDSSVVDEIADGRILTGEQALAVGLIDELGGFTKAVHETAKLAGISGEPKLIYPKKHRPIIDRLLTEAKMLILSEKFMNFWQPMFLMRMHEAS